MRACSFSIFFAGLAAVAQASYINYTTVTGYFLQDEASTDASTFDYTAENFGLINRTYDADRWLLPFQTQQLTQWERFYRQVIELNLVSPPTTQYKVLFLGRHGDGWHNAAESYYGTPAWNCYWAELDGNGTATWADAHLTTKGIAQAQKAHDFWQTELDEQHIHPPDSYYVSPLTRSLQTANVTFSGLRLPRGSAPFKPLVKEYFRESISIHTCDRRSNRTYIHDLFPEFPIEAGFTEDDKLWNGVTSETDEAQDVRSKIALDSIFSRFDSGFYFSITSHSGEASSLLRVLGHRSFSLNTGAVIPVLIKAETLPEYVPTTTYAWSVSAHCTAPPVTSLSACVCASSATPVTTPLVATAAY